MHRIKLTELVPPQTAGHERHQLPVTPLTGLIAGATRGQCACGRPVLGIRYEADREHAVVSNLPCGHARP